MNANVMVFGKDGTVCDVSILGVLGIKAKLMMMILKVTLCL